MIISVYREGIFFSGDDI